MANLLWSLQFCIKSWQNSVSWEYDCIAYTKAILCGTRCLQSVAICIFFLIRIASATISIWMQLTNFWSAWSSSVFTVCGIIDSFIYLWQKAINKKMELGHLCHLCQWGCKVKLMLLHVRCSEITCKKIRSSLVSEEWFDIYHCWLPFTDLNQCGGVILSSEVDRS